MKIFRPVIYLLALTMGINGYRILGLFPFNGPSHIFMFQELMKSLAERGHQVDVICEMSLKSPFPNITEIHFKSGMPTFINNFTIDMAKNLSPSQVVDFVAGVAGNLLCEQLGSEPIQNILKNPPKDPPYDVVIVEVFGAHCYMAIGHMLNVPVIGVSSADMYPWLNQLIAAPENLAWFPNMIINDYIEEMNFWWRLYNTVNTAYNVVRFNKITSAQDEIMRRHLGSKAPSYKEVVSNVALVLVNNHIAISGARDSNPALIDVGGLHISENGPALSKEVQKWLDESDGFIYFSFGSMVKIESLPVETLNVLYRSFEKIAPTRVLMKIAAPEELPPGLPSNVLTAKWLPQTTVLQHPKVKAFITHGGLLSTQEAIYFGVPIIGMPIFADQYRNVYVTVAKKMGLFVDINHLNENDLDATFKAILNEPIYKDSAKYLSRIFRDRPLNPRDTANYWVEYIIKYGSKSLRSPAMDLTWYQIALLDVYLFLFVCGLLIVGASFMIVKLVLNFLMPSDHYESYSKKIR